jgi:hypothetical protein
MGEKLDPFREGSESDVIKSWVNMMGMYHTEGRPLNHFNMASFLFTPTIPRTIEGGQQGEIGNFDPVPWAPQALRVCVISQQPLHDMLGITVITTEKD